MGTNNTVSTCLQGLQCVSDVTYTFGSSRTWHVGSSITCDTELLCMRKNLPTLNHHHHHMPSAP
jgi:hypothetical protein